MASTLAAQLQGLAKQQPQAPTAILRVRGKPSLLFDYQRAADIDLQSIYELGCQGLEELIRIEPRFRPYRESLFSRAGVGLNPEQQTSDVLAKVDESIAGFCCLLSSHFLVPAAFKALEYLIRRFRANERNVDSLMLAALPYHATNEFVRLVQTLALGAPGSLWGWLSKMQDSGAALPRELLVQRMAHDRTLMAFACSAATRLGCAGGASSAATAGAGPAPAAAALPPPSRTYLSFYAVTLCEVVASLPSVSEDLLAALLPHLLAGLGADACQDYRAATLMVVSELCGRVRLGRDFIKVVVASMLKHSEPSPEHVRTCLLVLAHVAVTQPHLKALPDKALKYLFALPNVLGELQALAGRRVRLGALLLLLCRSLVGHVAPHGGHQHHKAHKTGSREGQQPEQQLLRVVHSGLLGACGCAQQVAALLLEAGGAVAADADTQAACQKALRALDLRHPQEADAAVNAFLAPLRDVRQQQHAGAAGGRSAKRARRAEGGRESSDDSDSDGDEDADGGDVAAGLSAEEAARFAFVRGAFAETASGCAPCGGSMMTLAAALSAPQAEMRRMALQQLDQDLAGTPAPPATRVAKGAGHAPAEESGTTSDDEDKHEDGASKAGQEGNEEAAAARAHLATAALARLQDDDLGVVVAALGLGCLAKVPPAALLAALQPLLRRLHALLLASDARQPGFKAARRAARKAVVLLGRVAEAAPTGAAGGALRDAVAVELLCLMLPARWEPALAAAAAEAAVGEALGLPLMAALATALPSLRAAAEQAHSGTMATAASASAAAAGSSKGGSSKKKAGGQEVEQAKKKEDKKARKAARREGLLLLEHGVVAALSSALQSEAHHQQALADVMRLAALASEQQQQQGGAQGPPTRAVHLLLMALQHAAAAAAATAKAKASSSAATAPGKAAQQQLAMQLNQAVVQLAEAALPAAVAAAPGGFDWRAAYEAQYSAASAGDEGSAQPTSEHAPALLTAAGEAQLALVCGALRRSLRSLPDAAAGEAAADLDGVTRRFVLLALLQPPSSFLELCVLLVARQVPSQEQAGFLTHLCGAPPGAHAGRVQCMALSVQAQLAAAEAAAHALAPKQHAPGDVAPWLGSALACLSSPDRAVRKAALDSLETVLSLLEQSKLQAGHGLGAQAAAALCGALLKQRAVIEAEAEAACVLLRGTLLNLPAAATVRQLAAGGAPPGTPASKKGSKKGSQPQPAADSETFRLALAPEDCSRVAAYLVAYIGGLAPNGAGVNTASALLACLVPQPHEEAAAAAASPQPAAAAAGALLAAAAALLAALLQRLRGDMGSASAQHAALAGVLVRVLVRAPPTAVACTAHLDLLSSAATLGAPALGAEASASLATIRGAAAAALGSARLFTASPRACRATVLRALLAVASGDADEGCRTAGRAALEALPLGSADLSPLLDACHGLTEASGSHQQLQESAAPSSKKPRGGAGKQQQAAASAGGGGGAAEGDALQGAIRVLELLQWRSSPVANAAALVASVQGLLKRLVPSIGSISELAGSEADPAAAGTSARPEAAEEDEQAEGTGATSRAAATEAATGRSSLAGYAATLALQALATLASDSGEDVVMADPGEGQDADGEGGGAYDTDLVLQIAREAPDSAVRNAALGLLAALAKRTPQAVLQHVLEVLALVNESAALSDDEHSRAVAGTALAAVVPAWAASGRGSGALWGQVVASLERLAHPRRLDVLLALLKALPKAEEGLSEGLFMLLQAAAAAPAAAAATPPPKPKSTTATPVGTGKKSKKAAAGAAEVAVDVATAAFAAVAGPPPSVWLPELASSLALQVEPSVRLACLARLLGLTLEACKRHPHKPLPRMAVAFVTGQLKLKAMSAAAAASWRRSEPDAGMDLACRALMEQALAQMQLLPASDVTAESPAAAPAVQHHHHHHHAAARRKAAAACRRGLYALFGALQGVMAADAYLAALLTLVAHPSDKVKRRAIKLFTDKAVGVRDEIQDLVELPQRVRDAKLRQAMEAAGRACAMLPVLLAGHGGAGAGSSPMTRQLALVALAALAGEFGAAAQQADALLAAVPAVLEAARGDSHAAVRASALATAAALVRALGTRLVPLLPRVAAAAVAGADAAWARLDAVSAAAADEPMAAAGGNNDEQVGSSEGDSGDDEEQGGGCRARRAAAAAAAGEDDAALELSSALACLDALVRTLGAFLSPHLPSVLAILLNPKVLACRTAGCAAFAASIRASLPAAIAPRLLLPALFDQLQPCLAERAAAGAAIPGAGAAASAAALLDMVCSATSAMDPKTAAAHHEALFAFALRALDVRQRRPGALAGASGGGVLAAVEAGAVRCLVALVMKLSEARFRPLFLRLVEWGSTVTQPSAEAAAAGAEPGYMGRMVALFAAVNALADRLRGVLVPYFAYLMPACLQHLAGGDGLDGGGRPRSKKKQKRQAEAAAEAAAAAAAGAGADGGALAWLLRLRIVRALHRCFLHDAGSGSGAASSGAGAAFLDADRFGRLLPALVAQLQAEPPPDVVAELLLPEHADPDLSAYVKLGAATAAFTSPSGEHSSGPLGAAAVGCLLAMAVAANSDALWKPLNREALMLTRSGSARVRALGLEVAAQLVERLREEYLVLLPEALPFLAEGLEDVEGAVCERVKQVVRRLEEIGGEPLGEYLKA